MTQASTSTTRTVSGREIAALLHPRPVYLVTTCDAAGRSNVSTIAWITPLSHEPHLVGMCLKPDSRTRAFIAETGEFVINVVGAHSRLEVERCGNVSGWRTDKLAEGGLRIVPARCVRPPRLRDALAWLECDVVEHSQVGDHILFVARVLTADAGDRSPGESHLAYEASVLQCSAHDRFGRYVGEPGR